MSCQHKGVHAHFRSLSPRCHLRIVGCCAETAVVGQTTSRARAATRLAAAFHLSRSLFLSPSPPSAALSLQRTLVFPSPLESSRPTVAVATAESVRPSVRPVPSIFQSIPFISLAFFSPRLSRPFISRARCLAIPIYTYTLHSFFLTSRSPALPNFFLPLLSSPFFSLSRRRADIRRRSRYEFFSSSSSFLPVAADSHLILFVSLFFCFLFSPLLLFPPHFRNPAISYTLGPLFLPLTVLLSFPFDVCASSSHPPLLPSSSLPHHPRFFHARIHPRTTQEKQRWRLVCFESRLSDNLGFTHP